MDEDVTAQPLFDGTFTSDAVASAAHALVAQLHDEAMATIAALADGWDRPAEDVPAAEEPVVYREPATWSITDDEDEAHGLLDDVDDEDDEDDDVRVVPLLDLPALLPRPRPAASNVAARVELPLSGNVAGVLASAVTDEFAVPVEDDRRSVAV